MKDGLYIGADSCRGGWIACMEQKQANKGSVVLSRKKEFTGFSERAAILKKYLPKESFSGMWDRAKEFRCNMMITAGPIHHEN